MQVYPLPRASYANLRVIMTRLVHTRVTSYNVVSRMHLFLRFNWYRSIRRILFPTFFVDRRRVSRRKLRFLYSFVDLPIHPGENKRVLQVFGCVVNVNARRCRFRFFRRVRNRANIYASVQDDIIVIRLRPYRQIYCLANNDSTIPQIDGKVFVIEVHQIGNYHQVRNFLVIGRVVVFRSEARRPRFTIRRTVRRLLIRIRVKDRVLRVFVRGRPLAVRGAG